MKPSIKAIILTAIFAMGANSLLVAQPANTWAERWYRAKFGRPSPTEQARNETAKPAATLNGTAEQYSALANHYFSQEQIYKQKAAEEMRLWRERSEMVTPLSEKWPRPVDSARNLHDYYEYKAKQSAALFAKYSELADAAATK